MEVTTKSVVPLLGVAFIVLKLCGVINWSWYLVTLPLWIGPAFALALTLLVFAFVMACGAIVGLGHFTLGFIDGMKKRK